MSKLIPRVRALGRKAAQLQQTLHDLPAKIDQVRGAVAQSAGQLRQAGADLQSVTTDLRADSEERIAAALAELSGGADVIGEAGYRIAGIDLQIVPFRQLRVNLVREAEVDAASIERLAANVEPSGALHAALAALANAARLTARIDLSPLEPRGVSLRIGGAPDVRVEWREPMEEPAAAPASVTPTSTPAFAASSGGGFFEPRVAQPPGVSSVSPVPPQPPAPAVPPPPPVPVPAAAPAPPVASEPAPSINVLDRFKKMPDLRRR